MSAVQVHFEDGDLLAQDAIRSVVRQTYHGVRPTDRRVAERFYSADELAGVPEEAIRMALGVGNPVRHADLRPGQDVVDLGSGGGIDCLLAARAVGPSGSVVGVDFLPDMVRRAAATATESGVANVRFVEGLIEALPLPESSADVVISNGVVNLSPRKVRVLAEAFRVLRPGGRLAIVDLVLEHDLPPEIQTHPAAWAGCLSGALSEVALYKGVRRAGFREVSIEPLAPFGITECALYPLFGEELLALLRTRLPVERHDRIATSVLVRARKPAGDERLAGRARE
jgi:arsenite methyltransferase